MEKSRLLEVYRQLDQRDIRLFGKFVRSPFFNQQEALVRLWDHLQEQTRRENGRLEKKVVFGRLFPGKAYNDQAMRLLMSDLYQLIGQYIGCRQLLSDPLKLSLMQALGWQERQNSVQFERSLLQAEKTAEATTGDSADLHWDACRIGLEKYMVTARLSPTGGYNFSGLVAHLDTAFLATRLRIACLAFTHKTVYGLESQFYFPDELLRYLRQSELLQSPLVGVYYHCYLSLRHSDEAEHFQAFKTLLIAQGKSFPANELRDLYLFAINYCIRKVNENRLDFFFQVMDLYKEGLQTESLMENGQLSRFTYHNIVAAALQTGEYAWAEQFIQEYKSLLAKEYRESSYSFNLARLAYRRKQYDIALPLLQKANYRDLLLNLAAKTLLLKIYYELSEHDLLHAHLTAMKTFIRRKRVIGYHHDNYLKIVRFTVKLLTLNRYDRAACTALRQEIEQDATLTEREWLLEQL
ncbi:MAG: hypothetical protein HUU01_03635 [Saprospiraceae bacterium]|nr:hypothetical protein [Saprospiraceae bacterium]